MKKGWAIVLSLGLIVVIVVSAFVAIQSCNSSSSQVASKKPFYVGVTYCGNSSTEAEQLIDKVKNYTNLFVLDSGPLMQNVTAMEQICDYAVNSGLNVIACFGTAVSSNNEMGAFLNVSQAWGSHFLGLYLNDEPGGKMLDGDVNLYINNETVTKQNDGWLTVSSTVNGLTSTITFTPSGQITMCTNEPNGTYTFETEQVSTNPGNISQFEPYQEVWDSRPLQTYTEAANAFVNTEQQILSSIGNQSDVELFTSDYGLYWFDYMGGYNTVFAELFGGQTDAQTLALVRGAADMQNKSWGVMIEPASQSPLSLQTGGQMYNEMRQAYENGAEYVVVFNYSPSGNGTGLLQDEQFASIQKFWTDVVQNPKETNNVTAQDALVLPSDYGWGMRNQKDTIWGLWGPDNDSSQVWNALQASLAKYGSKLDIVYADPTYPTAGRYQHVYYWNQTI
jgi:hypothetical protein